MCLGKLFSPKIPKVDPAAPPPIPKAAPELPDEQPEAKPLRGDDEKARVTYGTKRDKLTAEGASKEAKKSIVPLNRSMLSDPGKASQSGVGGSV